MKTLYLILALSIGLLAGYFLFNNSAPDIVRTAMESTAETEVKIIEDTRSHADSILKEQNKLLGSQLRVVTSRLKSSKNDLEAERQNVITLKQSLIHDSLPCKNKVLVDSLVGRIDKLNAITDTMFSIYETKLKISEELVAVRDSQLVVCNTSYRQMQDLVKEQLLKEQQLTEDLNTALKQQKKRRFQNKALAFGMLFVSGFTTSLIIKSKQ